MAGTLEMVRGGVMARRQVRDPVRVAKEGVLSSRPHGAKAQRDERKISLTEITQLEKGESQSHTPACQAHFLSRVRYPGASGGPRRVVVALTETSGISEIAVPFRKQTSLV